MFRPDDTTPQIPATTQTMSGADLTMRVMHDLGVDTIFGYPGGAIMPIYDSLSPYVANGTINHVLTAQEQGAGHMAQGFARATGKTGVTFVTSGPGIANMVTPVLDAMSDSIPVLVIAGQVPTHLLGTNAFQEAPIESMFRDICKDVFQVTHAHALEQTLRDAHALTKSGRPGPVVVSIPKDIQQATVNYQGAFTDRSPIRQHFVTATGQELQTQITHAAMMLANAKRPLLYVGGGVINAGPHANDALQELMAQGNFPVTSTLMGLGAYPTTHANHLGMVGMHGTFEANMAMDNCDVLVAIGARFDDRVTGNTKTFSPHSKKIHIDIDDREFNKLIPVDCAIHAGADTALKLLNTAFADARQNCTPPDLTAWHTDIANWRNVRSLDDNYSAQDDVIYPQQVLQKLNTFIQTNCTDYVVATNVGKHQMWAAQYIDFNKPGQFLTSGGLGTMGYGLPASIGAQMATPDRPVFMITGDASWRMNANESETAARIGAPVKIILIDDNALGMVTQWQDIFHGKRHSQSHFEGSRKDFCAEFRAQAVGQNHALQINKLSDLNAAFKTMLAHDGPFLLHVKVKEDKCLPMIPGGKSVADIVLNPAATARRLQRG